MEEIADNLLKEVKKKPLTFNQAKNKFDTSVIKKVFKEGAKVLVGPIAKGISIPADSIKLLATRGAEVEFEADIVEYIKFRKTMEGRMSLIILEPYKTFQQKIYLQVKKRCLMRLKLHINALEWQKL